MNTEDEHGNFEKISKSDEKTVAQATTFLFRDLPMDIEECDHITCFEFP